MTEKQAVDAGEIRLEPAKLGESAACFAVICEGRAFQGEQGILQWTENYPTEDTVREDIEAGRGYKIMCGDALAGYLCVDFAGDPLYMRIRGAWHTGEPYAVVHRMAFTRAFRGKGLASVVFGLVEEMSRARGVRFFRVDTDETNALMQHVLEKCGFARCGIVEYPGDQGEKVAFDKTIG